MTSLTDRTGPFLAPGDRCHIHIAPGERTIEDHFVELLREAIAYAAAISW